MIRHILSNNHCPISFNQALSTIISNFLAQIHIFSLNVGRVRKQELLLQNENQQRIFLATKEGKIKSLGSAAHKENCISEQRGTS